MSTLSKTQIQNRKDKVSDRSLPIAVRRKAHEDLMSSMMNPKKAFNPQTFDPMDGVDNWDVKKRPRYKDADVPSRLPTQGMKPKQLLDGQMIGMFESKQDLYLMMAHYVNLLLDEIDALKADVDDLKNPT